MTGERRSRDLRVKATFRVRYQSVDELVLAYSKNLSRGGLFLASKRLLERGSIVRLNIELPDGGPELTVPCKVVFVRSADSPDGKSAGMGVKFIDPDDVTRRRLEWFIVNCAPEPGQFGPDPQKRKLDIMIVEDDPLQSETTAAPFRNRGDTVRISQDGLQGLASCLERRPDVILSDVQMPKMDGWQFLRMVRSRPALATVPVLFLTTLSSEQDRLLGYRLGVDDYIAKPPKPSELVARVDRAVVRAEQQSAVAGPTGADALRGELEQVSIQSMLAFLEAEQRSGVLRIGPENNARIYIMAGRPVRVEVADAPEGRSARQLLFDLLDLHSGRFEFRHVQVGEPDEIQSTATALLLEHAKECDERR